jgi:hypothetical protein
MFARLFRPPLLFALAAACLVCSYAVYPAHADEPPGGARSSVMVASLDVPAPAPAAAPSSPAIGTSPSGPVLADPGDPGAFLAGLQSAAKAGKWLLVLALICNALVWLLRFLTPKILPKLGEWFGTDKGGTVLALLTGVLSVLVIQLQAGRFDVWMLASGLAAGLLSIGNYTAPKKATSPS